MSITQLWPFHVDNQLILQGIFVWYVSIGWVACLSIILIKYTSPSVYSTLEGIKQKNKKLLTFIVWAMLVNFLFLCVNVSLNGSEFLKNVEIPSQNE